MMTTERKKHLPFIIFFVLFLITGLSIYHDYGVSWDEPISRDNNGILNYDFIKTGNPEAVIKGNEKYHGPAFEVALVLAEKIFKPADFRQTYFLRHLLTFIVFAISVLFFYILCFKYFKDESLSVAAVVFLVLSPRIFADAFYNSKDLTLLSFTIISIYTTINFIEKKTYFTAICNALVTAFVIDIRIIGLIIPGFTFIYLLFEFVAFKELRTSIVLKSIVFIIFLSAFIILFWPVLYLNPVKHFLLAWKEMSKYPWDGNVFFMGKVISGHLVPWQYMPVWIIITTPILYLLLFVTGIIFLLREFIRSKRLSLFEWLNIYVAVIPVAAVIILHSVVYDGWRHLYFIYPSFIIIAVYGLKYLFSFIRNIRYGSRILITGIVVYSLYIGYIMAELHPYEHVYFNSLGGESYGEARKKFEGDYWGLSYRQGLEYILKNDTAQNIIVYPAEDYAGWNNSRMLTSLERERISLTDQKELADYMITTSRNFHGHYNCEADYEIKRDKGVILSLFDLRKRSMTTCWDKFKIAHYGTTSNISNQKSFITISNNSDFNEEIKSNELYSSAISIHPTPQFFSDSSSNYISVSFLIKSILSSEANLILEADSGRGKMYKWMAKPIKSAPGERWRYKNFCLKIPEIYSLEDEIKVYVWNYTNAVFTLSKFQVDVYSIPLAEKQKILSNLP